MDIYHYPASSTLEIADGSRTTTIELPKSINPTDVAWAIKSDTMRTIIEQLTDRRA